MGKQIEIGTIRSDKVDVTVSFNDGRKKHLQVIDHEGRLKSANNVVGVIAEAVRNVSARRKYTKSRKKSKGWTKKSKTPEKIKKFCKGLDFNELLADKSAMPLKEIVPLVEKKLGRKMTKGECDYFRTCKVGDSVKKGILKAERIPGGTGRAKRYWIPKETSHTDKKEPVAKPVKGSKLKFFKG